jgi:hypothetical protein
VTVILYKVVGLSPVKEFGEVMLETETVIDSTKVVPSL